VLDKKYVEKTIISESFFLYNTTNLNLEKNKKIKIENMKILYEEEGNLEQKHAVIGLNYDTSNKEIPYIINELKRLNAINNYDWSFRFISKEEGQFIIGDIPHNYEKNKKYFNYNSYTKFESSSGGDYSHPWSVYFSRIYFMKNDTKMTVSEITKCTFDLNFGFVTGNTKYKKLLLENYFNELIEKNICQLEKTDLTKYSKNLVYYGTNGIYELFVCDKNKFINEKINYKKQFMPLLFDLPKYNFTFNLSDSDLFMEIGDKYYFLVAFPENEGETYYIQCFLGLPFYLKYRLVFNFDSKTIGFYKKLNNREENGNNGNNDGSSVKTVLLWILWIGLLIITGVGCFLLGKMIYKKRKQRANELEDDYEYKQNNNEEGLVRDSNGNNAFGVN
jgi:hypothetical protein